MTTRTRTPLVLALVAALLAPSLAQAEPSAQDTATARKLFDEAAALMNKRDYDAACAKLAAAMKLDKKKGIVINYAVCLEAQGKLASAWSYFQEGAAMARAAGDPRAAEAERRWKAIEPRLAKIKIEVPEASRGEGLVVKRDGTELDAAVWGTEAPVDPGEHRIEVTRPGYKAWSQVLTVDAKPGTATVTVPALERLPEEAKEAPKVAAVSTASKPAEESVRAPFWSGRRIAGATVAGAGLVGVAVGAVFGVMTLSKTSEAEGHCQAGDPAPCDPIGRGLYADAKTTGNVSTAAFAVGGAALIAGAVLLVLPSSRGAAPPSAQRVRVVPLVGMSAGGMTIHGEW